MCQFADALMPAFPRPFSNNTFPINQLQITINKKPTAAELKKYLNIPRA